MMQGEEKRGRNLPSSSPYGAERCGGTAHQNQKDPSAAPKKPSE
uniref:Uncharacterized protein n=1 Tax=Arundo donax TaxID=35708 RepID=A0A0A8YC51_ARUDO